MRFARIFPLVFAACFIAGLAAQLALGADNQSAFSAGVIAFQKGDLKQARQSFHEVLKDDASEPTTLFNLGLVEMRDGKTGLAIGLWRRALTISPRYKMAQDAIEWARPRLERGEIPHEVEFWEILHQRLLRRVSLDSLLVLSGLFLLSGGWFLLRHLGARRQAQIDEKPMPGFPTAAVGLGVLFAAFSILSVAKALDAETHRGTIIVKKVDARSSPEKESTPLFELFEGLEVILRQEKADWALVTYPGGSTGWIPRETLLATTDSFEKAAK